MLLLDWCAVQGLLVCTMVIHQSLEQDCELGILLHRLHRGHAVQSVKGVAVRIVHLQDEEDMPHHMKIMSLKLLGPGTSAAMACCTLSGRHFEDTETTM